MISLRSLWRREVWFSQFWCAMTMGAWAALALWAGDDLGTFPSLSVLLRIGDDDLWTRIALGLALAQFLIMVLDHRPLRCAAAFVAGWFWSTMTIAVWLALPGAPSTAPYGGLAMMNIYAFIRLLRPLPRPPP